MKKLILILVIFLCPLRVYALTLPEINSNYSVVYDLTTDELLLEKNSTTKTSIASLTKILTTITAIEHIEDLNEVITITSPMLRGIYWNASVAGLKVGDSVTYRDLLYASMLPSGADATQVLAISISGDIPSFVTLMNNTAQNIGMLNSNFVNVTGLDAYNHYSTTQDVLTLLKYALSNPTFKEVYQTKSYNLSNGLLVESTLKKYNENLNLDLSRILGSKSGYTDAAGLCLSSIFEYRNHELLIITIGARYSKTIPSLQDALTIIDYIDHNYAITTSESIPITVPATTPETIKNNLTNNYRLIIFASFMGVAAIFIFKPQRNKKRRH